MLTAHSSFTACCLDLKMPPPHQKYFPCFYRWFAIFYLIFMFFLFPLFIFGLSLIGPVAIYVGFIPLFILFLVVILVNVMQVLLFLILNSKKFGYKIFLAWIFSRVSLFVSKSIALSGQVPQVPAKLLEGLVVPARVSALTGSVWQDDCKNQLLQQVRETDVILMKSVFINYFQQSFRCQRVSSCGSDSVFFFVCVAPLQWVSTSKRGISRFAFGFPMEYEFCIMLSKVKKSTHSIKSRLFPDSKPRARRAAAAPRTTPWRWGNRITATKLEKQRSDSTIKAQRICIFV